MTATARQQLAQAMRGTRRGRYPVVPVERRTVDGIVFASGGEAQLYAQLKLRERAGEISHLEPHPAFRVSINGDHFCRYTADFSYFENGEQVVVEKSSTGTRKEPARKLRRKAAELFYRIKIMELVS